MADDLRQWLRKVEEREELRRLEGADWNLEIGCTTTLNWKRRGPALLFDKIKGYPPGFRVLTCSLLTPSRIALTFGLSADSSDKQILEELRPRVPQWEARLDKFPPKTVKTGPILENVLSGKDVDLFRFPVPLWHEKDGGRYIGTGDAFITMDPDSGAVNLGAYRVMVCDSRTVTFHIQPTHDGHVHIAKYHDKGKPCPVAVSVGQHPLIFGVAGRRVAEGVEYRYIGAIREEPVEVIEEEVTGLPIPADSEIVIVGWCPPGKTRTEGPFAEGTGYYGAAEDRSIMEVERIYYRNNPILMGSLTDRGHTDHSLFGKLLGSLVLENRLKKCGVRQVKGVFEHEITQNYFATVAIKQQYVGHAKQAGLQLASLLDGGRFVIVVDEDVDITSLEEVLWAVCTRANPLKDVDIISGLPVSDIDPIFRKGETERTGSKVVITACRPYAWMSDFPEVIRFNPELIKGMHEKWSGILEL